MIKSEFALSTLIIKSNYPCPKSILSTDNVLVELRNKGGGKNLLFAKMSLNLTHHPLPLTDIDIKYMFCLWALLVDYLLIEPNY